jgi:hypothetical protein
MKGIANAIQTTWEKIINKKDAETLHTQVTHIAQQ